MDVIVGGEFRKALSKQGNAISKSAEVLEDEKLHRLKTHILTVFNDYVVLIIYKYKINFILHKVGLR